MNNTIILLKFTFHYGPIQIIFNLPVNAFYRDLHSTMVLFKLSHSNRTLHSQGYLHSTMVLFKFETPWTLNLITQRFTFHYGPIQIEWQAKFLLRQNVFTFHYGPIQIMKGLKLYVLIQNLHSTMVLFKLLNTTLHIYTWKFTFHYGPIQIIVNVFAFFVNINLHSTMVLFKCSVKKQAYPLNLDLHSTMVLFK